jgi:hypothetical protein
MHAALQKYERLSSIEAFDIAAGSITVKFRGGATSTRTAPASPISPGCSALRTSPFGHPAS